MSKLNTHLVFIIQAHEGLTPQNTLSDSCEVEVIDTDIESALERAKKLIVKKEYRVRSIIEVIDKE